MKLDDMIELQYFTNLYIQLENSIASDECIDAKKQILKKLITRINTVLDKKDE